MNIKTNIGGEKIGVFGLGDASKAVSASMKIGPYFQEKFSG